MRAQVCLVKVRINPSLAGLWLDGANRGWHITTDAIDVITNNGWYLSDTDAEHIQCWRYDEPCDERTETGECSCGEAVNEIYDDAEEWINARAPEGYSFGFYDGSWYFQSHEWWEENEA